MQTKFHRVYIVEMVGCVSLNATANGARLRRQDTQTKRLRHVFNLFKTLWQASFQPSPASTACEEVKMIPPTAIPKPNLCTSILSPISILGGE